MDAGLIPWVFGTVMVVGVVYMLISLFAGDLELDGLLDGFDFDLDGDNDVLGISCGAIAAFMAAFGAVGWGATLAGSSVWLSLLGALAIGYIMGGAVHRGMRYLKGQQSTTIHSMDALLGKQARATINIPSGKMGEAMIEAGERLKYPIREIDGLALARNDLAEVVEVHEGFLLVRKLTQI